jgi:hypothetical protein
MDDRKAHESVSVVVRYPDQTYCVAPNLTSRDGYLCWTLQLDLEFFWSTLPSADCSQRCVCVGSQYDCSLGAFYLPASVIVNGIHTQGLAGR